VTWRLPDLGPLERVRRYVVEEGFTTGIYVNKSNGQFSIAISRKNVRDMKLEEKFGLKAKGEKVRFEGKLIEGPDHLKMLLDNKWFDGGPVMVLRLMREDDAR
jgi:hypothetical protein